MLQLLLSIVDESDHEKITYLYKHFHDDMIRFAKHRLYMAHVPNYGMDAEDAVQDAFLKISKYIKSVNLDVSDRELKAYMLSIVSNAVADQLKKMERVENIDDHFDIKSDENFVEELMIQEQYGEVVTAIEQMDEKYRVVLLYRFGQGYDVKQIAEMLGIPEKTVYTRILRAQKKLRELVKGEE